MSLVTHVGGVQCRAGKNDITTVEADTMLVPVHQTHVGKGGVFAAAKQAGAIAGCETLENWHELSPDFMRPGEVLTAAAGGGKTKFLSHAASVCEFGFGRGQNFAAVVLSVQSVLEDMKKRGLKSVSIPMMGTGQVGWLDAEQSARAMMIGVQQFAKSNPNSGIEVQFCVQDDDKLAVLNEVMRKPSLYTDISPDVILAEKGKAAPPAAEADTHRAGGALATRLAAPPKFVGAKAVNIRTS